MGILAVSRMFPAVFLKITLKIKKFPCRFPVLWEFIPARGEFGRPDNGDIWVGLSWILSRVENAHVRNARKHWAIAA